MINESSTSGFVDAMNAAFNAAYAAASDPRVSDDPTVVEALALAKAAHSDALSAIEAAQAATGVLGTIKATMAASKATNRASVAEVNLRTAIDQLLSLTA